MNNQLRDKITKIICNTFPIMPTDSEMDTVTGAVIAEIRNATIDDVLELIKDEIPIFPEKPIDLITNAAINDRNKKRTELRQAITKLRGGDS